MSDNLRQLIIICCVIFQIVGVPAVILWNSCKLAFRRLAAIIFRILFGICGAASVVKFFVTKEPGNFDIITGLAGLGIILIAYFDPGERIKNRAKNTEN